MPGYVDVFGTATNTSTVTVNQQSTYRHGDYYRAELSVDNSSAALWVGVTNVAVITNAGPDIVTTNIGNVFKQKTPELFAHDADGNLTNDGHWAYTWDGENRLLTMTAPSAIPTGARKALAFTYDFQGRRVTKTVSNWNGSAWSLSLQRKFLYDDWNLITETDNSNVMQRQFMWGADLSGTRRGAGGVGGLVKVYDVTTSKHLFPGFDGNGNVTVLADGATGAAQANYEYGPFGELLRISGSWSRSNPLRFSTKYQDDETDFPYYGYRYYNPSTGRWLSRDPIDESGGLNLYAYVDNASNQAIDALGQAKSPLLQPGSTRTDDSGEVSIIVGNRFNRSDREMAQKALCLIQSLLGKTYEPEFWNTYWAKLSWVGKPQLNPPGGVTDAHTYIFINDSKRIRQGAGITQYLTFGIVLAHESYHYHTGVDDPVPEQKVDDPAMAAFLKASKMPAPSHCKGCCGAGWTLRTLLDYYACGCGIDLSSQRPPCPGW